MSVPAPSPLLVPIQFGWDLSALFASEQFRGLTLAALATAHPALSAPARQVLCEQLLSGDGLPPELGERYSFLLKTYLETVLENNELVAKEVLASQLCSSAVAARLVASMPSPTLPETPGSDGKQSKPKAQRRVSTPGQGTNAPKRKKPVRPASVESPAQ